MARGSCRVVRLGIREVEARIGVRRSTLWRWYRTGRFPEPEYVTDARTWRLDELVKWEQAQLARSPAARRGRRNLGVRQ